MLSFLPMDFKIKSKHIWLGAHKVALKLSLDYRNAPFKSSRVPQLRCSPSIFWVTSLSHLGQLPGACHQQLSGRQTDRQTDGAGSFLVPPHLLLPSLSLEHRLLGTDQALVVWTLVAPSDKGPREASDNRDCLVTLGQVCLAFHLGKAIISLPGIIWEKMPVRFLIKKLITFLYSFWNRNPRTMANLWWDMRAVAVPGWGWVWEPGSRCPAVPAPIPRSWVQNCPLSPGIYASGQLWPAAHHKGQVMKAFPSGLAKPELFKEMFL